MRNPERSMPQAQPRGHRSPWRRIQRWASGAGYFTLAVALATGCAKARAETAPEGPPLAMPAPPPRVIGPMEETLATSPAPETPAATAPRTPPRAATPPRRQTPEVEPARPDPVPAAAQPAPAPAEPAVNVRPLPADPGEERKVRDILTRASRDINRVDYRRLSTAGRDQYEQSKRFAEQAEEQLRERNYPFAVTLADKAAALAAQLLAR